VQRKNLFALIAGLVSIILGLTVIVGWYTHNFVLLRIHPAFVAMAFNTALGFAFSGSALVAATLRRPRISMICANIVILIGFLTLLEYACQVNLRIDELFMRAYIRAGIVNPGRMAVCTAFCFVSLGVAIRMHFGTIRGSRQSAVVVLLGTTVMGLGIIALTGYFTGVTTFYTWGKLTRMAAHTAVGFIVVGMGVISLEWTRSRSFLRLLPILAGGITLTAALCLWQALIVMQHGQEQWMAKVGNAVPPPAGLVTIERNMPGIALTLGLIFAVLKALSVHLAQLSHERALQSAVAKREKSRLAAIVESSGDCILSCDLNGDVVYCNEAAYDFFGQVLRNGTITADELLAVGGKPAIVLPAIARMREGRKSERLEIRCADKTGAKHDLAITLSPVINEDGVFTGVAAIARDVSAMKEIEQQIREYAVVLEYQNAELELANSKLHSLARVDGLTGIANQRAFRERAAEEFVRARDGATALSIIMLDVDRFKQYNDTYGHPAGDEVLRTLGGILSRESRAIDFVARYGGEEFILVLPRNVDDAMVLAKRIRAAVEKERWPLRSVTISCGVSTFHVETRDVDELVALADKALYKSKIDGRNRVTHAGELEDEAWPSASSFLH